MSESPGLRRLDAEEVNRRASELDGRPYNAESVEGEASEAPVEASAEPAVTGTNPAASDTEPFPPTPDGDETIGGSVEDRSVLREEEAR